MRYLFTLYHPKKKSCLHLPLENEPDTIPTRYYIADEEDYEAVKARHKPLSQLSWFVERDFDENEDEMYLGMSDAEYFLSAAKSKAVYFVEQLQANWYPLLKSSKKTMEVYLFGESPLRHGQDHLLGNDLNAPLKVHLSKELMEKLLEESNYRVHIPYSLKLEPEYDLMQGLDFKMYPWREGVAQESLVGFTDQWIHWFWVGRNQGMARFPAVQKGVELEMNTYHVRQYLENLMRQLVKEFENGDQNLDKFRQFLDHEKQEINRIAPQLMLHATTAHAEKYRAKELEDSVRKLNGRFLTEQKEIRKVASQSRKIDFDQWLEYLTRPTKNAPPMIRADLFRTLNRILISLDGNRSIFQAMLADTYPDRFHLKFSLRRDDTFQHPYEGVRVELDSSILSRFHVLAETWT